MNINTGLNNRNIAFNARLERKEGEEEKLLENFQTGFDNAGKRYKTEKPHDKGSYVVSIKGLSNTGMLLLILKNKHADGTHTGILDKKATVENIENWFMTTAYDKINKPEHKSKTPDEKILDWLR